MGDNYNKAKAISFEFWWKWMIHCYNSRHMVHKALDCKVPKKIPHIRLRDTEWGRNYKQLYGKEYGEI